MKRWNAWLIVIIIMGGIFYLSSIPGLRVLPVLKQVSSIAMKFDLSFIEGAEKISERLPIDLNELNHFKTASSDFYVYAKENPIIIEFILRKIAHIIVFFLLTLAIFFLINQYTKKSITAAFLAYIICAIMAALDELRQSFVDGRVSSLIDVGIDLIGITSATFLIIFAIVITKKWSDGKGPLR